MSKNALLLLVLCIVHSVIINVNAQAPFQFNFQGVARNINGEVIVTKPVTFRFSIRTGSAGGPISYREERFSSTDSNGVFNAVIGSPGGLYITGRLDTVRWAVSTKFLQVEMDTTSNGINFIDMGATQLLSVPYALHANSSGSYFFEAVLPTSTNLSSPGTILFPRTNYNDINPFTNSPVYDSTKGVFIAPTSGIYQFDIFLSQEYKDDYNGPALDGIFLTKNGTKVRMLLTTHDSFTGGLIEYFQLHCTIYLNRDDTVSLVNTDTGPIAAQSTFSGYKVY